MEYTIDNVKIRIHDPMKYNHIIGNNTKITGGGAFVWSCAWWAGHHGDHKNRHHYLAIGRRLFDASLITAPTLILASERDFWSRPEDRQAMADELVHSLKVRTVVIAGATHFVHLDRPEHGRDMLLKEISEFVK
jgi:pimeloyl-ACP methyl ester carboxylesterase